MIIAQSGGDRKTELELLRGPRAQMVDGIMFSPLALGEQDTPLLAKVKTPMVLLGERILEGPKDHVTMRNTEGARAATEHLLAQGRRRIVAFGTDPNMEHGSAGLRLDGYRQALEAAGVPFDPALTVDVIGWFHGTGATAMRSFLEKGIPFDGLVGFNDLIALGAMRVLQEAGLRVPHDVAVIGYDDIDEARYSLPSLSTIDPGRAEIAEVAVRYLKQRIASDEDVPGARVPLRFPTGPAGVLRSSRLVARSSLDILPGPMPDFLQRFPTTYDNNDVGPDRLRIVSPSAERPPRRRRPRRTKGTS